MAEVQTIHDVACGFCGLGCGDLTVEVEGRDVRAKGSLCPEAARLLRRLDTPDPMARVAGEVASPADAARAAHQILAAARAPLIGGLGVDMAGAGAAVDLAIRFGGVLDHYASDGLFRNYAAVQRTGWLSTTLAEVRNRCDVLLVVGDDPTATWGRLFERLYPVTPLFADQGRTVVFLGGAPGDKAKGQLAGAAEVIHHATPDPVAVLEALGSLIAGRRPPGENFGGIGADTLAGLAEDLRNAHYAVVTWNAADLADGDLVAERATALVDTLNVTTRAGVFPLGGRDNIIGVNQLMLWRLGYPLRTAVQGQASSHDGTLYATQAALGDADVLVWVSAFRPEPPPAFGGKIIALAHPDTVFDKEPDVLIPVGTPGVDHAGTVFRMDSIVSLPLGALRVATLPSVAEAVRRIAEG
ncbi:formylmethanofuran dehydrogenase subunit B [Ancylobacter aquaticus]|uniref:Formylmethanofuran dehydrogenase subunit B n=1 Tax=Ancylobacter aquaticus TaxID=100 RepID=A0A4R1I8H7_ANCAQ|nr:formylmethanofuran dehydrogenase [Ancylobacter aquaticus]TCK31338.1 formylmethanofuran dehydrogenase subunit B [Ancylobacter aquaticus]